MQFLKQLKTFICKSRPSSCQSCNHVLSTGSRCCPPVRLGDQYEYKTSLEDGVCLLEVLMAAFFSSDFLCDSHVFVSKVPYFSIYCCTRCNRFRSFNQKKCSYLARSGQNCTYPFDINLTKYKQFCNLNKSNIILIIQLHLRHDKA